MEFEAIRGPSYHADIALDDIYFRETPCGKTIEIAFKHSLIIHKLIGKSCQPQCVTCSGFKPDKTFLISIRLYTKNTNKIVSIVVVSSLVFLKNTNKAVYLLNL